MKFVHENYRASPFAVIVGQDYMSDFASYFLLKSDPVFRGYINLSPDYTPNNINRLQDAFDKSKHKIWYYLATAENDVDALRTKIRGANAKFSVVENENFYYYYDDIKEADHFSMIGPALPEAFQNIFSLYKPISQQEYDRQVLKANHYVEYLIQKYETIYELYALEIEYRVSDFMYIQQAIEKNKKFEQYKDLSKLAQDELPKTLLGHYFRARYFEEEGKPKKPCAVIKMPMALRKLVESRMIMCLIKPRQSKKLLVTKNNYGKNKNSILLPKLWHAIRKMARSVQCL